MTLLDKIPDSEWFFCFPMYLAVYCITGLGIIHPLLWISVMRVYRSELFVFMYVLIIFWALLSVALLYAIIEEFSCIYVFWIWYTIVFGFAMAGLMFLLFCGFCVLGMRRKSIVALIALLYYLVTVYFVVIVNKQRKEVFGINASCGTCAIKHIYPYAAHAHGNCTAATPYHATQPTVKMEDIHAQLQQHTTAAPILSPPPPPETTPTPMTTTALTTVVTQARIMMVPAALMSNSPTAAYDLSTPAKQDPHWNPPVEEQTSVIPTTTSDRNAAIARLSELLVSSNECRKPRKPAHGRFHWMGRRGPMLKLTLQCDPGYRENSVSTQCKYNWWDRPIPACRKRKSPGPLPYPGGGCIMPGYPTHGEYHVADHARARPGDHIVGDNVILLVTCDEPYRAVDPYVICVEGHWRHAPPSCQRHCKLVYDPTVDYKCLKAFKDEFLACGTWQPEGTIVAAACKPGHAHRGPFRYMKCRGESWDHVVTCQPNANFTR